MGKIDIAIVIIVALFLLIGLFKGFVKQILSFGNWLIALIGSFLLVKPVSSVLTGSVGESINNKLLEWISTKGAMFEVPVSNLSNEQFSAGLTELGSPKFISDLLVNLFKDGNMDGNLTLGEALAGGIGSIILTIITFIVLFIILMIILKILINLLNSVVNIGLVGVFNKILGAVLGLAKGLIIVSLLMLLASVVAGLSTSVNEFIISDLNLGTEAFGIGKYFYENNPLLAVLNGTFDFNQIIKEISG